MRSGNLSTRFWTNGVTDGFAVMVGSSVTDVIESMDRSVEVRE